MSEKSIKTPATSDNNFAPKVIFVHNDAKIVQKL